MCMQSWLYNTPLTPKFQIILPQIVLKNAPMSFAVTLQTNMSHVASKTTVSVWMLTSWHVMFFLGRPSVTSPSCPNRCSITFCSACYYSDKIVQPSFICDNLCSYPPTRKCLYRWAFCLRGYSISVSLCTYIFTACICIIIHVYILT